MYPHDADSTFDDLIERQIIDAYDEEASRKPMPETDNIRVAVDFNERDGRGRVRARLGDARQTVLVGTAAVLFDPVEGIQTEGELVRIERDTGLAAFKVNWWGFQDMTT